MTKKTFNNKLQVDGESYIIKREHGKPSATVRNKLCNLLMLLFRSVFSVIATKFISKIIFFFKKSILQQFLQKKNTDDII